MGLIPEGLQPKLTKVCIDFLAAFPGSRFSGGNRNPQGQANAMAKNIVKSKRRDWIADTYRDSAPIRALQKWVTDHTEAFSQNDIALGLMSVFDRMTPAMLSLVSCHFTGEAVDIDPMQTDDKKEWNEQRKTWLYAKAKEIGGKFIEKEGGLVVFHFQLRP